MRILKLTQRTEAELMKVREGQDRAARETAGRIVADVRRRGDAALNEWTRKLDGGELQRDGVWISRKEFQSARKRVSREFLDAAAHAAENVRRVAERQKPTDWNLQVEPGVKVGQIVRPIETIGCYIPGGRFALISTLMMTVVPAQVAGVRQIIAVCPRPNDELLAVAGMLGMTRLAKIGGAQAIAAVAYGTQRIPRVEKIFGPGNRYVTAAKQIVSEECAIDLPAGPTEAVVLANRGNPAWIAADLLAQAEHAPDAGSFLVTTSARVAKRVQAEVAAQLVALPKENPAQISIRKSGAILLARTWKEACGFVNRFAPEHLSLPEEGGSALQAIHSAGTVFLGPLSAQAFGDYASGSNHVLPTGGWARRRGGLSTEDFVKRISVQRIDRKGYQRLANDVALLARAEGLHAHANAIEVRRWR
ncbi:MAG TPA: histidinol dehydrogenase [Candidatus Acidoferrum sp.]|jgi:histidinol dehydrogenase